GRLGITLTAALTDRGLLRQDTGFALTDAGLLWFDRAGIALDRRGRRPLARACLDRTERRPHLAGAAGAALCGHALAAGWCVRIGSGRAVKVTDAGERALSALLGIEPAALRSHRTGRAAPTGTAPGRTRPVQPSRPRSASASAPRRPSVWSMLTSSPS